MDGDRLSDQELSELIIRWMADPKGHDRDLQQIKAIMKLRSQAQHESSLAVIEATITAGIRKVFWTVLLG